MYLGSNHTNKEYLSLGNLRTSGVTGLSRCHASKKMMELKISNTEELSHNYLSQLPLESHDNNDRILDIISENFRINNVSYDSQMHMIVEGDMDYIISVMLNSEDILASENRVTSHTIDEVYANSDCYLCRELKLPGRSNYLRFTVESELLTRISIQGSDFSYLKDTI